MPRFRKLPVEVEAVQFLGFEPGAGVTARCFSDQPDWLVEAIGTRLRCNRLTGAPILTVETLEGELCAMPETWIVRGIRGELYPCDPSIFAETYEPAEQSRVASLKRQRLVCVEQRGARLYATLDCGHEKLLRPKAPVPRHCYCAEC